MRHKLLFVVVAVAFAVSVWAQAPAPPPRAASPGGTVQTQVGGKYVQGQRGQSYQGGKWIEITYGRPILRQRDDIFGSGADYGKTISAGSPVWRAGANQTTRILTEAPLIFEGRTLPAGEYSMFVELKENAWTLVFSNWPAQTKYDPKNKEALWGSFGYTPDRDVLRTPMRLSKLPFSVDQFTIAFVDMTAAGGGLAMMWGTTMAVAPFRVGT